MNGYLIFHSLVELFSVVVAWSILMVAWNSRNFLKHSFFLFLGAAYAATGLLDLVHTLAFKGMGVFAGFTANQPTQLWIAARYVNAVSVLLAPLFLTRRVSFYRIALSFAAATFGLLAMIFAGWFPDCFLEGTGLTPFKDISEYMVCVLIAAGMGLLWYRRDLLDKRVLQLLLTSLALTIAAELSFTLYTDVYGFFNALGHILKLVAFFFLYKAVVVTGLQRPYEVLFRDLRFSEERYRNLVSNSPDAIVVQDNGQVVFANAAAMALYGAADYETLAAHTMDDLISAEELTAERGHQSVGQSLSVREGYIIRMDGSRQPVEVRVSPIQYGGRNATQIVMRDLSARLQAEMDMQHYNEELRQSRAATLNLLQDAIIARQQAEQAGEKLRQEIAERQQAEEALRESREDNKFLADLIRTSSQAVGIGYPNGQLGMVNPAFEELTGYTDEELKSIDWASKLTPPEWRQIEAEKLDQLHKTGKPVRYEKEYIRKDGSRVPIELLVHMVKDAEGNPQYYYSFISDITERKQAEEALRQSREDLNRAQAVGSVGSWRLDVRKNELTWSDENHRMFGIPKGTPMTYETFLSTIHPDDREYVDTQWQAGLAGEDYDVEHRIVVDGKIKWVREKAFLEFDENGNLIGGFGITQDITRRRRMQEKLRIAYDEMEERVNQRTAELGDTVNTLEMEVRQRIAAEQAVSAERQKLNDVLDLLPLYVVLLTEDYQVPFANRVFRELFGYRPDKKCYEFLFNRTEPCEVCETYSVLKTGKPHHWEWTGPNGRNYDIYDFPFTDSDGSRLILEMGIDITERKQTQERIRLTNILLELFTKTTSRKEYLDAVVEVTRDWTQCQCIGIRLLDAEGKIPYESWIGFSEDFLAAESDLSLHDDTCLCIRAITQTPNSSDTPLITSRGSFHSGDALDFLKTLSDEEKGCYRGTCMRHGFASLAVVPICYRGSIIGAIHLADKQKNKMPADAVAFLESMAMLVGEAVHRFNVEESLQASRSRLLNAQHLAHIGNWEWDLKTGRILWSDEVYRIFGVESGEFDPTYEIFLSYVHPEDRKEIDEAVVIAKNIGAYVVDHRIIKPDGTQRFVHEIAEVVYDEGGNPVKMAGTTHDVTEQKQAEWAIREHQQALRAMAAELQLAEERQRRQIAQDLHDSIGPILAFSTRELQTLKKNVPPELAANLENVTEKIDIAIQQARTLSFDLSPSLLYDLGLEVAIEDLLDRFAEERKIPCHFRTCPKSKPLSEDVKIILYRSVRELLINAAKHAEPSRVDVSISRADPDICIRVEDDGLGFDVRILDKDTEKKGFGLFSIRERLTHIGGDIKIESAPGRGTIMILTAPLDLKKK